MVNSGMMICSFYLKKLFSRGEKGMYSLNSEYINSDRTTAYVDIFDMVQLFCRNNVSFTDDEKNKKMFSIRANPIIYDEVTYRAMVFTIRSGAYGIESDMTNRKTKKVKYRRGSDDADIKDFKCVMFVPKDEEGIEITKGILIFQTIATYGVKSITTKKMGEFFVNMGLKLETRSVSVRAFIDKLVKQGTLNKVTLIKNAISHNDADNMLINTGREEISYFKPQFQPGWFQELLLLFDRAEHTTVYEIEGKSYEDIKVEFKLGKRYRTVGLRYIDRFSVVEDIPDTIYKNGIFKEEILINYMIDTAVEYMKHMLFAIEK